jgi:hypothetical protein
MDKDDLTTFFKAEVPAAQPGDEQVSKFVGEPYTKGVGTEALLDIEFMMCAAPTSTVENTPNRSFHQSFHRVHPCANSYTPVPRPSHTVVKFAADAIAVSPAAS